MTSGADVALRPATTCDAAAISSLLGELDHPTSAADVARRLAERAHVPGHRVVVAEIGGAVVGLVEMHAIPFLFWDADTLRITALVVTSGARRLGVGAALVAAAEDEARRSGAAAIELTTALRRTDAHAFYRAQGYETSAGLRFVKRLA